MSIFSKTGKRAFLDKPDIIDSLRESINYTPDEDLANASGFILFDSKLRRRWLIATRYRLSSVTDDTGKREPVINWSIFRSLIVNPGGALLQLKTYEDGRGKPLIDIGYRPGNKYTPELFNHSAEELKEKILRLVEDKVLSGTEYKLS